MKWGLAAVASSAAFSLGSAPAFAQSPPWGEGPAPSPSAPGLTVASSWTMAASPPPVPAMPPPPVIRPNPSARTERVLIELGGGALCGLLVGAGGLYVGVLTGLASDPRRDDDILQTGLYGAVVGAGIGIPIGVYLVGSNFRGNGGFGWTLLGSLGGSGVTFGLAALARNDSLPVGVPVLAGLLLPLAGTVLGYELSSQASVPPTRVSWRVVPWVTGTAQGGHLGLIGTF